MEYQASKITFFISWCLTSAFTSADIFCQLFGTNWKLSRRRFLSQCLQNTSHRHPIQQQIARSTKFFYWCSLRWSFVLSITFQRYIFWWVSVKCFKKAKQSQLIVGYFAGLVRKKKAAAWSPLASFYPRQVVNYRWSKK